MEQGALAAAGITENDEGPLIALIEGCGDGLALRERASPALTAKDVELAEELVFGLGVLLVDLQQEPALLDAERIRRLRHLGHGAKLDVDLFKGQQDGPRRGGHPLERQMLEPAHDVLAVALGQGIEVGRAGLLGIDGPAQLGRNPFESTEPGRRERPLLLRRTGNAKPAFLIELQVVPRFVDRLFEEAPAVERRDHARCSQRIDSPQQGRLIDPARHELRQLAPETLDVLVEALQSLGAAFGRAIDRSQPVHHRAEHLQIEDTPQHVLLTSGGVEIQGERAEELLEVEARQGRVVKAGFLKLLGKPVQVQREVRPRVQQKSQLDMNGLLAEEILEEALGMIQVLGREAGLLKGALQSFGDRFLQSRLGGISPQLAAHRSRHLSHEALHQSATDYFQERAHPRSSRQLQGFGKYNLASPPRTSSRRVQGPSSSDSHPPSTLEEDRLRTHERRSR